jgi:small subunit ribosomal protein S7
MPRRREVPKRKPLPDSKFREVNVSRFINCLMSRGKKSLAEKIFYDAMDKVSEITNDDPLVVFKAAMENAKPAVEVKARRIGGSTYQVPVEIRYERRQALAMRWIISFAKGRSENGMSNSLAAELIDAANNRGPTVKKKDETHRMAEANKAFAHYKW